ncbi:unnamed protein product [Symbiodinium natans]|uniref:Uncharacterized protein n=1 Tax=Symbiodinium natans TaxID=878477 RepID=A0A812QYQ9_9DINO|nr:unnamed protein product [Symbiodinium natans]
MWPFCFGAFQTMSGLLLRVSKNSANFVVKLSSGRLQWTTQVDVSAAPAEKPRCAREFAGIACNIRVFQNESYDGLCPLHMTTAPLCKGIIFAAAEEHWWRCGSGFADCDSWFTTKFAVQNIYEAELADLIVDGLSVLFGLVLLCCRYTDKDNRRLVYVPLAMTVGFMADIVLEARVVFSAMAATGVLENYKASFCFSIGDGYATIVKLEDMLGTISTLATVNILVACVGGFVEVFDVCREARGKGPAGWPFFVTNMAALCELILGVGSFAMNTVQFRGELEAIEDAALNLQQLEEGHLCYHLNELMPRPEAVGMRMLEPLWIAIPGGLVIVCFFLACCFSALCGPGPRSKERPRTSE